MKLLLPIIMPVVKLPSIHLVLVLAHFIKSVIRLGFEGNFKDGSSFEQETFHVLSTLLSSMLFCIFEMAEAECKKAQIIF